MRILGGPLLKGINLVLLADNSPKLFCVQGVQPSRSTLGGPCLPGLPQRPNCNYRLIVGVQAGPVEPQGPGWPEGGHGLRPRGSVERQRRPSSATACTERAGPRLRRGRCRDPTGLDLPEEKELINLRTLDHSIGYDCNSIKTHDVFLVDRSSPVGIAHAPRRVSARTE